MKDQLLHNATTQNHSFTMNVSTPMEIDPQITPIDDTVYVILDKVRVGMRESIWAKHSEYLKNAILDAKTKTVPVKVDEKSKALEITISFPIPSEALQKIEYLLRFPDLSIPTSTQELLSNESLMKHLKALFPMNDDVIVNKKSLKDPNEGATKMVDVMNLMTSLKMEMLLEIVTCYFVHCRFGTCQPTTAHLAVSK